MRKKVVSAGLVCLDVTPVFPPTSKKAADIFVPGRLIEVGDVELATAAPWRTPASPCGSTAWT